MLGDHWDTLADIPLLQDRIDYIPTSTTLVRILEREGMTAKELANRFEQMQQDLDGSNPEDMRPDEYRVFTSGGSEQDEEFETYAEPVPESMKPYFSKIIRVARLREVRVVRGFTRINPPFDPDGADVAPISVTPLHWLPAIEVRGEGIFFCSLI
ncbi:hypothetical protein ACFQAT_08460 [Undibacterium arcticum]|uniref:hypothetical protein n=1 Tax=Undibacterium arcticum TaxID=1762892 RepID=UPI00361114B3